MSVHSHLNPDLGSRHGWVIGTDDGVVRTPVPAVPRHTYPWVTQRPLLLPRPEVRVPTGPSTTWIGIRTGVRRTTSPRLGTGCTLGPKTPGKEDGHQTTLDTRLASQYFYRDGPCGPRVPRRRRVTLKSPSVFDASVLHFYRSQRCCRGARGRGRKLCRRVL